MYEKVINPFMEPTHKYRMDKVCHHMQKRTAHSAQILPQSFDFPKRVSQ